MRSSLCLLGCLSHQSQLLCVQAKRSSAHLDPGCFFGPPKDSTSGRCSGAAKSRTSTNKTAHWVFGIIYIVDFIPYIIIIIIIIINRRSGITSHTSHGHKTGTRSMQPVRSVPLGGPVVS